MKFNTRTSYTKNEAILIMLELGSEYNNDFIDSDAENTSDEFIFDSNTFNVIHEQWSRYTKQDTNFVK